MGQMYWNEFIISLVSIDKSYSVFAQRATLRTQRNVDTSADYGVTTTEQPCTIQFVVVCFLIKLKNIYIQGVPETCIHKFTEMLI